MQISDYDILLPEHRRAVKDFFPIFLENVYFFLFRQTILYQTTKKSPVSNTVPAVTVANSVCPPADEPLAS